MPGATGHTEAPAPHRVEQKAPETEARPRGGNRGRKPRQQRRTLETAVQDRRDIRNERDPLARRHLPDAHIDPDLLPARDRTRGLRVEGVTVDVDYAYALKRGAA